MAEEGDHNMVRPGTAGPSPELKASIFSICSWHWLQPFVSLGNTKPIEAEELYDLNPKEGTQHCEHLWNNAIEKLKRRLNEDTILSPWRLIWLCFGFEHAKAAIFKVSWLICVILQVYILRALVEVVENKHNLKWWWAMLLVLGMFLMSLLASISQHMCFTFGQKVGMKIRSTVSMTVYNKLLRTRLVTLVGTNSGFMLNLITNDTQKFLDATVYLHFVWFAIVEIGTISTLAITEIGASAVPGVIVAFLTQPLQLWMARLGARLRIKAVKYTDSRVHLTEEILNGIRVIKYNGWISPFLHRIAELRRNEMYSIKRASFIRATSSTIRDSITPLASLVTFGTYLAIHNGNFMSPSQAFTVLALFSILVRTFGFASTGLQLCGEAVVGVHRLQKLLNMDEVDDIASQEKEVCNGFSEKAIIVKNCSFCWKPRQKRITTNKRIEKIHFESEKNIGTDCDNIKLDDSFNSQRNHLGADAVLRNINFSVEKGELVAIFGAVGSGKSSLLLGLLGEMQCLTGCYFAQGNIAYVPQQPWILNDTLRQNIVFTNPFDPTRYRKTILACALEHDISQFPGGHDTEIGDRGINLSGGQKARIGLARACYSSAPIVFLDDPLAAVDVPTAKHLIEHVLGGILEGRTVLVVTHNKTALEVCDRAYFLKNGSLYKDDGLKRKFSLDTLITDETDVDALGDAGENGSLHKDEGIKRDFSMDTLPTDVLQRPDEADVDALEDSGEKAKSKADELIVDGLKNFANTPKPVTSSFDKEKARCTVKEERITGNIQAASLIAYAKASGGLLFVSFVFFVFLFAQAIRVMVDYWLRVWTDGKYHLRQDIYLVAYASIAAGAIVLSLSRGFLYMLAAMSAAHKMHGQMAEAVLRSPQLFFDQACASFSLIRMLLAQY